MTSATAINTNQREKTRKKRERKKTKREKEMVLFGCRWSRIRWQQIQLLYAASIVMRNTSWTPRGKRLSIFFLRMFRWFFSAAFSLIKQLSSNNDDNGHEWNHSEKSVESLSAVTWTDGADSIAVNNFIHFQWSPMTKHRHFTATWT